MARLFVDKTGATAVVNKKDIRANRDAVMNYEEAYGTSDIYDALRLSIAYKLKDKELMEEYTELA